MKNNGDNITEKEVMEKIMYTLTSRFDFVVAAIEESKNLSKITLNDLQASLESREMRMSERSNDTIKQALKAQANMRNKGCTQRRVDHNQRGQHFTGRGRIPRTNSSHGT